MSPPFTRYGEIQMQAILSLYANFHIERAFPINSQKTFSEKDTKYTEIVF